MLNTIDESAIKLTTSPRHIRRLIESNRLPHYRIGKKIRISDEQIAQFLRNVEVQVKNNDK